MRKTHGRFTDGDLILRLHGYEAGAITTRIRPMVAYQFGFVLT
jgi:hypothetical protein